MLVADRNEILALEAVGWSNIDAGTAMQTDAMFWIASQPKSITAAALMMLVDAGQVNLDTPVEHYLPEFRGQMLVSESTSYRTVLVRLSHPITNAGRCLR